MSHDQIFHKQCNLIMWATRFSIHIQKWCLICLIESSVFVKQVSFVLDFCRVDNRGFSFSFLLEGGESKNIIEMHDIDNASDQNLWWSNSWINLSSCSRNGFIQKLSKLLYSYEMLFPLELFVPPPPCFFACFKYYFFYFSHGICL